MSARSAWLCFGLALLAGPAAAQNPKVTLQLRDVTCAEATAALARASSVPLRLYTERRSPDAPAPPPDPALAEKSAFDWRAAPLGQALRELCGRYRLRPIPGAEGFTLAPPFDIGQPPLERIGLVEKAGVRLVLSGRSVRSGGRVNGEPIPGQENVLGLTFDLELGERDWRTMADIQNVAARDNLGRDLPQLGSRGYPQRFYPDRWAASVSLGGLDPAAKRLAWVQGNVMIRRTRRRVEVRCSIPAPGDASRKALDGNLVELLEFSPAPQKAAGTKVRARITVAAAPGLELDIDSLNSPVLVGASGKAYHYQRGGARYLHPGGSLTEVQGEYGSIDEPIVEARFGWTERSPLEKLFTFRIQDVPLPQIPPVPAPPMPRPAVERRPFLQAGGAAVATRVELDGRPARGGTLALRLSRRDGAGWTPPRWVDVEVGNDGVAMLRDLQPGTYRIRRAYRPARGTPTVQEGRWAGVEVILEVTLGRETKAPPLRRAP